MTDCTKTYVALGSNLGDSHAHFDAAITALRGSHAIEHLVESPRYLTDPMGPPDQPDYVNSVCSFDTSMDAHSLLNELQRIEIVQGRSRPVDAEAIAALRWQARTLDLDILLFGDVTINDERLTIPHIGIAARSFVLQPLFDLNPGLTIPSVGAVAKLLAAADKLGIRPA